MANLSAPGVIPGVSTDTTQRYYASGWKDLTAKFSVAAPGGAAPTVTDIGNGHRLRSFGVNDSMFIEYHVLHDYKLGTLAYPHIHFLSNTSILAGQTVVWQFIYTIAKGHQQNGVLNGTRSTIELTFTAPRNMDAGEHIVLEGTTIGEGFDMLEPDCQILAEVKRVAGTFGGSIFGIQADLHYESDHDTTIGKQPDFDVAD